MLFQAGEQVLYRGPHVDDSGLSGPPSICDVRPTTVVEDSARFVALFLAAGTPTLSQAVGSRRVGPRPGDVEQVEHVVVASPRRMAGDVGTVVAIVGVPGLVRERAGAVVAGTMGVRLS